MGEDINKIAATISIGLHAALLATILVSCDKVLPLPIPKAGETESGDIKTHVLVGQDNEGNGLTCTDAYKGIGIHVNYGSGVILDVGIGTPAAKAGLQEGDVLLEPDRLGPNMYEPHTLLRIPIQRNGKYMLMIIAVGTICNE